MASQDFSPAICPRCNHGIWQGLGYAPVLIKLDSTPLNLPNEIIEKLTGGKTYEAHRTAKSFEVTPRSIGYLSAKDPIVLAKHRCPLMMGTGELPKDLWNRGNSADRGNQELLETMEVPF